MKDNKTNRLLIGLGFITAGVTVYALSRTKAKEKETEKSVTAEIKKREKTENASYSDAQFKIAADTLKNAMFDVGTDEDSVFRIFGAIKNDLDYLKLFEAFGIRSKTEFGFEVGKWNLVQWLQDELTTDEINNVNLILQRKKIKYRI